MQTRKFTSCRHLCFYSPAGVYMDPYEKPSLQGYLKKTKNNNNIG